MAEGDMRKMSDDEIRDYPGIDGTLFDITLSWFDEEIHILTVDVQESCLRFQFDEVDLTSEDDHTWSLQWKPAPFLNSDLENESLNNSAEWEIIQ
jgi:hypothetical protein